MTRKQWITLGAAGIIVTWLVVGYLLFVPRQGISARNFQRLERYQSTRPEVEAVLGKCTFDADGLGGSKGGPGWCTAIWKGDDVVIVIEFYQNKAYNLELHPRTK